QHQDVPFERLVEELAPRRSLAHTPLFQAVLSVRHAAGPVPFPAALRVEPLRMGSETAKFDLTLDLTDAGDRLEGALSYRAGLWDVATVERMLGHLRVLLESAAADPARRVSEIPLMEEGERREVLAERNATARPHPRGPLVHERVAAQARLRPEAAAVVCGGRTLSYAELDRRAGSLAGRLRALGIGPESRVGVCLERSPELVVAMLAILRAGAAYLPLDPSTPGERIATILADAGVQLVLAHAETIARLPADRVRTLLLDAGDAVLAGEGGDPPAVELSADSLAYVVYTSGSTGTPKGVMVPHGALLNLVHWHRGAFAVTEADRATQLAGLGFDAAVWETWPYLASGAALHLVPDEETRISPPALQRFLLERGITLAFAPTPLAEALLALEWPREAPLRTLLTGGDALRARPRPDLPFALVNAYGPTENTVVATAGPVPAGEGVPDLGGPVDNVRAYVLDRALGPVPVGVPGELYLGGAGVARGYLGRPGATAASFVPDSLSGEPGARLYATGDRVRWMASGGLEFLGRTDFQVKIRGFRIEPGEIEVVMAAHPRVAAAAVVLRGAPGARRLAGYVAARPGETVEPTELRAYLAERLPEYMVP
ncbi:MAG TPA: amino acid adenylation domain-containing protein, partial [Longimicrobiaceae bacterium]|nr:amino acid adenylation domain-containing protein [Longimicrobiaceae bacterium]